MQSILIIERNIINSDCCKFLEQKGFRVTKIDISQIDPYIYKGFLSKIINIFLRVIFKYKNYPYRQEKKFHKRQRSKIVDKFLKDKTLHFDKIIIIRPDYFEPNTIKKLSKISPEIVGYFWDSISFDDAKLVSKSLSVFKNLYSYDKNDISRYKFLDLKTATNFYYPLEKTIGKSMPPKFYYLGNITLERRDLMLEKIISKIHHKDKYSWNILFNIFPAKNYALLENKYISYIEESTDYKYHLVELTSAFVVFDINPSHNSGLSFRFFEALYYKTKIITTNKNVSQYDFYNPDNILIYDKETTQEEINLFLEKPFIEAERSLVEKYRVDNWVNLLFR